jgi:hypothetical protein
VTRGIHDQVREKIESMRLVPVPPPRSAMDVILGRNRTLLDDAEYYNQHAVRDRAAVTAVRARGELMFSIAELAELPARVSRAYQLRAGEFDVAMQRLEYEQTSIECALSEFELQIAKNNAARRRVERDSVEQAAAPGPTRRETPKERAFNEKVNAERGIRDRLAAVITEIEAMDISDAEKAERIKSAVDTARDLLQGAE